MSHSFNKIWVHAVWSTKNRLRLINPAIEKTLFDYLRQQFIESGCPVRIINGMPEHVHCLFLLNPNKTVTEVIKQVKGSSSHHINQQSILNEKFAWQTGYANFSVSESGVEQVYKYISNQKQHHRKRTFQEEYEAFLKLHNLDKDGEQGQNG
ncbi:MAG: IS200/IS605 family transposase [Bacteroidetes bacterium]|jgi:putative transposase|nr:IS200/IS605 family transposase [Bacteroidota bacterium]